MHGIARETDCDWRTAKKRYEIQKQLEEGLPLPLKEHKSILNPYTHIIDAKLEIAGITVSTIYHFLIDNTDYSGKYSLVKNYVKRHKQSQPKKATIHVPKVPGKLGQVDWKEDFTYCRLTLDKKQDTVINSLIYTFMFLNGVPKEIWFDNMITIVDAAKMRQHDRINEKIKHFAKDISFTPITCRPKRPQTKGAVEAFAKLCDRLLAYNNEFESVEDLKK